ncbi:MAG: NAD(P)H-dependent oxidoreductase [Gammaproteobacteria bacterium]|jgi:NAD(P)H dehydrogenase (quinone)|nr:NADPH quinone oxidoreductase [Chromatiales bacterium]MCP4925291.1 NAD(P)H-dependent oxidoreductase [Gammaproteobacteria bacterium]MDP7154175.1 NAD(P)H-dependent oxidoreductase [Gammaproteobacteria bacterium]MDP7296521.1 NAD(P)H-dependent oxidoreductase [Gammaproteobacteria bacterium]MDP7419949.1 NAD(P)H-dependent oxidoreductase [Gammaproteobacteria bacterium]
MKVLIVYAHPEPQSFGGALLSTAVDVLSDAGHTVVVSDLYAKKFSAMAGPDDFTDRLDADHLNMGAEQEHAATEKSFSSEIQGEIERLFAADLLLMQFPLWWYSVPAIMKGWIDRVFAYGVTYDFGRTWDRGIMQGKRAMLSFTTGAPESTFAPDGRNGDLERVLWPLHAGVFAVCGFNVLQPFVGWAPAWVGDEGRQAIIAQYTERLRTLESDAPLFFHPHADYDEQSRLRPETEPGTPGQHRGTRRHLR